MARVRVTQSLRTGWSRLARAWRLWWSPPNKWFPIVLILGFTVTLIWASLYFVRDKGFKPHEVADSLYLRIYIDHKESSFPVVTEIGVGQHSDDAGLAWIMVSFPAAPNQLPIPVSARKATFGWKIALLCVPKHTRIAIGTESTDIKPVSINGNCSSGMHEIIVSGRYPGPGGVPMRDLAQDNSGEVSFGIPLSEEPIIEHSGDDYQAAFPYVTSRYCAASGSPRPSGAPRDTVDGGPAPGKGEPRPGACQPFNFTSAKVLDLPAGVEELDTSTLPTASFPASVPRTGLAWSDTQDNRALKVETDSPYQDAQFHADEVIGTVLYGVAAAILIALLTEVRDRWPRKGSIGPDGWASPHH